MLPYAKSGGDIGGGGNDFDVEWMPVSLSAPVQANLALTVTGNVGDRLDVFLYVQGDPSPVYSVTEVYGGETIWLPVDLAAGTSRIKVEADGGNGGA